jgi:hypothetical protein
MNFKKVIDVIQVFANEYCIPGNIVLIIGLYDPNIKDIFSFIDTTVIFVNNTPDPSFDIISEYHVLPFEEHSFDIILNFTNFVDIFSFIKPGGYILTSGEILNGISYYHIDKAIFTVI